ncbi:MAG TPA: RagB/SusD family nutrient uptake outer membrane protein [Longimicrobiaceae bacterium]|nr:RagB/SusD family nutrient uptake outer membrane protein [Longimicrobiaceae bacterium]
MSAVWTPRLAALLVAVPVVGLLQSCTDLSENPTSAITPDNFYRNADEVLGGLAGVYAQLRSTTDDYYNLSEISTDEMIVPTRGQDWYDNGTWLEIHHQTWTPTSASGLGAINGAWVNLFQGVARANALLAALPHANMGDADKKVVTAEARTLRAFYYYLLMDMFGGVPIVTDTDIKPRPRNTRAEVFDFIETELKAAREDLPETWSAENNGRMTQGAVDAILASMYLNAQVWTGTVTESGLQPGQARWQDAIDAVDRILNSGVYSLAANFNDNFTPDNSNSPEIIMQVKFMAATGLGLNFVMRALHYSQFDPSPWNGFATLAQTYYAFDTSDKRMDIFLEGPQDNVLTGQPVNDRSGKPLFFDPTIKDPTQATEGEGVRIYKWPADPNHVAENNGNDYAFFRLAEMYLIKAEALNELGKTAEAVDLVNKVRARDFSPPQPLNAADYTQATFRDRILEERLFELTAEAKRRQDLIRHGEYTAPFGFKDQREPYRILMPIPQTQIDANPMLEQNPGYGG